MIDWFFIVDGDLNIYLIPSRVIAGRIAILLHTYTKYIVGNAGVRAKGSATETATATSAVATRPGEVITVRRVPACRGCAASGIE